MKFVTPVHGEKFERMYEYWSKAILRVMPDAELIKHHYNPPSGRFRYDACAGDWGKAEATSIHTKDGPIFIMDVDSILIKPFEYAPENPNIILSMPAEENCVAFSGDVRPITWEVGQKCGLLKSNEQVFVNPQFFWTSANLLPYFDGAERVAHKFNTPDFMLSLTIWMLVWLQLRNEGKAEQLPQPEPVWHCPNPPGDRLSIFKKFYEFIMNQPIDSLKPPGKEFLNEWL